METTRRILVIEDDNATRDFVSLALRDEGFIVTAALDAVVALAIIADFCPHLILLDLILPDMDGRAFLAAYRASFPPVPVIGYSAAQNMQRQAEALGLDDFIEKPFNLDDLLRCIYSHLAAQSNY